jgi:hypothetical protein
MEADIDADGTGGGDRAAVDMMAKRDGLDDGSCDGNADNTDEDTGRCGIEGRVAAANGGRVGSGRAVDAASGAQNESKKCESCGEDDCSEVAASNGTGAALATRTDDGCDVEESDSDDGADDSAEDKDAATDEGSDRAVGAVSGAQNESKNDASFRRAVCSAVVASRDFNTVLADDKGDLSDNGGDGENDNGDVEEFDEVRVPVNSV